MWTLAAAVCVTWLQAAAAPVDVAREVVVLANLERVKQGLCPLKVGAHETKSAQWLADDMAASDTASHTDSLGRGFAQRAEAFGIQIPLGENEAAGFRTPQALVTAWLGSPKHRANLLAPDAKLVGVGYAKRATGFAHYWTMVFADSDDCLLVINNEAPATRQAEVSLFVQGRSTSQQIRLSNDGVEWSPWRPFERTLKWTLASGAGEKTVQVEVEDVTGTVVRASAAIVLRAGS